MDGERPRDRQRDRRGPGEPRDGTRGRGGTPGEGRHRSRSPRRDRRRDDRYRSRSPFRRDDRDRDGPRKGREERGDRGDRGDRVDRNDRGRNDFRGRGRDPPKGPRGGGRRPDYHDRNDRTSRNDRSDGAVKPPTGPQVDMKVESENHEDKILARPEGMDDETWEVFKTMGFCNWRSTKNTKVPGNAKNYAVRKDKKMEARQYMNRQGGFNRPLSPSH
ncbi:hypothetical protein BS50DRAFT_570262 [Corynespora cassiicola Philippines]|uniref:U4/U6.U5 small nuclear ribonucleoprotein 27kDa protein domain-containing protein n=1 Tax=Corynespora cassiicola Philippines TaxID=1448308 RepID=A0A2T2P079_CORCC|nr:hypothetical protein BS50DRAFT_570262 [Corynespora cassiicola Philippines]